MKRLTVKDLSVEEKLRLLCSKGFWYTMDFDGKLPSVSVSDGPVGVRAERKNEKGETITLPSVSYPSAQLLSNTWNKALIFPNINLNLLREYCCRFCRNIYRPSKDKKTTPSGNNHN